MREDFWCTLPVAARKQMAKLHSNFVSGLYLELLFDEFDVKTLDEDQDIQEAFDEASQQVKFDYFFKKFDRKVTGHSSTLAAQYIYAYDSIRV